MKINYSGNKTKNESCNFKLKIQTQKNLGVNMKIWELIVLGVGLSMDAFAVAVCKGVQLKKFSFKFAALIALFFGGFQAIMPLIGWLLGTGFEKYITSFDHWIAFALLLFLGVKMIVEGLKKGDFNTPPVFSFFEKENGGFD